jgi:hypothetical protein
MFSVKMISSSGRRNVSTKGKGGRAVGRLRRDSIEGKGLSQEFYEKPLEHAFKGLGISKIEGLKVKTSRPKKYISLNF